MADEAKYGRDFFVTCNSNVDRKLVSILNGYDEEDFEANSAHSTAPAQRKFVLSYVGTFYDGSTFMNVKHAFEQWQARFPWEFEDVEFHYAGANSALFDEYAFRPEYLRDHGYVSHPDAIAIRARSAVQIFSQPASFKPHVISGKIYEMMRLPVPILAITDPSGTVARFIRQTGTGIIADNRDAAAAGRALREMYLAWKNGYPMAMRDGNAVARFSRKNQAHQLSHVMERIISERTVISTDGMTPPPRPPLHS
jgi:hypothetical protein